MEAEASVKAQGRDNQPQVVRNGGRFASQHPVPGSLWTEGQSTAQLTAEKEENEEEETEEEKEGKENEEEEGEEGKEKEKG